MKSTAETRSSGMKQRVCFTGFIILLVFYGFSIPVPGQQKPSRQSSLEAYSKGDYELAYSEFSELLVNYPKDPLYKYYSGVCLVKLKREPDKAVKLLQDAKQNVAVVRSIPPDILFWLGRAQQLSGMFGDAVDSYNSYTVRSGKKAAKDLGIPEFIRECTERKGSIGQTEVVAVKPQIVKDPVTPPSKKDTLNITPVNQAPVTQKSSRETISTGYDRMLSEALRLQSRSDSIQKTIDIQKAGLEKLSYREKSDIRSKISVSQHLADSLQNLADSTFTIVQEMMNKTPFMTTPGMKDSSLKLSEAVRKETAPPASVIKPEMKKDTIPPVAPKSKVSAISQQKSEVKDSARTITEKTIPGAKIPVPVYSYFVINPKPVYKPDEKVKVNPVVPPGLIYRIQIAVFRNPVAPSYFKGISPVFGFKSSSGLTVYYVGMFRRLADANRSLAAVRKKGFKDAFVASIFEGKTVSAERAAVLEKEWGKKPFTSTIQGMPETKADTIPPTLTFRVEVMRSKKPVKDDVIEGIKKMAGTRGMEIVKLEDDTQIFLIGMFITYESAAEYADLLVRNGYRESKVAAWLGKKEIPIETAKELFDRLK